MKHLPNATKSSRLTVHTTRIVLGYLILGVLWILLTDRLLDLLVADPDVRSFLQTIKGWAYIAITAGLLYWLIHRGGKQLLDTEKALQETGERYRQVFERNPAIKMLIDPADGTIIETNQAAADFYGYSIEQMRGMNIEKLSTMSSEDVLGIMQAARNEELTISMLGQRVASGDIRNIEAHSGPIVVNGHTYIYAIIHDITTRVQAEEKLRRQNEELAALHETTLGIINRLDPDSLFEAIVNRATGLLDTPHVFICLIKENENGEKYLFMPAASGFFSIEAGQPLAFGDGLTEQVWRTRQAVKIDDYSRWRGRRTSLDHMPIHSVMASPLNIGEEVWGVLGMAYFEKGRTLAEEQVDLFGRLAELAALALQNARLYTEVQQELKEKVKVQQTLVRHNEELSALQDIALGIINHLDTNTLLDTLLNKAASLIGTPHAYLYLVVPGDEQRPEPHLVTHSATGMFRDNIGLSLGRGEGIGGTVWETGEVLAVDNYRKWAKRATYFDKIDIHAVAGIPLKVGSEVIGVIGVAFFDEGRKVSPDEVAMLGRFAKLASVALQNARLYTSAQQELKERIKTEAHLQESVEAQRHLLAQLLTAQEAERRRLSMEIHDGPLQSLGVSLLALDRTLKRHERGQHREAATELEYMREMLVGIVDEVRDILSVLSLDMLNTYGLASALHDHAARFAEVTGIKTHLTCDVPSPLPTYIELLMYRLVQESLANVRKHSDATDVEVRLVTDNGNIVMTVTDNGKGFNVEEAMQKERAGEKIGLHSMSQRLREARGEMHIESEPGKGTTITFVCPLPPEPEPEPEPVVELEHSHTGSGVLAAEH